MPLEVGEGLDDGFAGPGLVGAELLRDLQRLEDTDLLAGDVEDLSADAPRLFATEGGDQHGYSLRALERPLEGFGHSFRLGVCRGLHRVDGFSDHARIGRRGAHGIDADSMGGEITADDIREAKDAALARSIGGIARDSA